eukprot:GGOE01011904.1.p1 GENE.GGOE01011904.1~~GGOE01011904.1.p1  ORF type:complete len:1158 (+),score=291.59 GGOE01011904.1:377-3475(+)
MATSVVAAFNLGVTRPLVLSMQILAWIFQGSIVHWDDPNITALNPSFPSWGIPAGQPIEVVVRQGGSAISQLLRQALGGFDNRFALATGAVNGTSWGSAHPTVIASNQLVVSYIMATPFTLGYTFMGDALDNGLDVANLQRENGYVVEATPDAVQYALLELGGRFGLDGTDPDRLTASLCNAVNPLAWPIVGYSYVALRKRTLREGATCESVEAMTQFLKWFLMPSRAAAVMARHSFSPLPSLLSLVVIQRLDSDIQCDNETVSQDYVSSVVVSGAGPMLVKDVLQPVLDAYNSLEETPLTLDGTVETDVQNADALLRHFSFLLSTARPSPHVLGHSLLLGGVGIGVMSQVDAVLDISTLARILDGNITRWLDPAVRALNPNGLFTTAGVRVTDGSQRITLLKGPVATSAAVASLMQASYSSYTGKALHGAANYSSEIMLRSALLAYSYSLSIGTLSGVVPVGLALLPIQRIDGNVVGPSPQSVAACASGDVFDTNTGIIQLNASLSPACYPLSTPVYLTLRPCGCTLTTTTVLTLTVQFATWLFNPDTVAVLSTANLATFSSLAPVAAFNANVLAAISCTSYARLTDQSSVVPMAAGFGAGLPVFVIAVAAALFFLLRRGRRDVRRAPRDPAQSFCVLFTDIEGSTAMWAKAPVEMAAALEAHHSIIRDLIEQFKLYEVKTIGDSFMCVTSDPRQAVEFAMELQNRFFNHDWGTAVLDDVYCAMEKAQVEQQKGAHAATLWISNPDCWNGLRVRVGLHCGVGDIKFDPVAKGYDYYGTVVNTAARIVEISHGGQIAMSQKVRDQLPSGYGRGVWLDLGSHALKGLPEPTRLLQVLPDGPLSRRQFPALRHANPSSEGTDFSSSDVASRQLSSTACFSPDSHPLVVHGLISGTDLHTRYMHALSTLRVLLSTQTSNFRNQVLMGLCGRLKVRHVGNAGPQLQLTLHRIVMRILPALAMNTDPTMEETASEGGCGSFMTPLVRNRSYNSEVLQEIGGTFMPVIPVSTLPGQMDPEEGMAVLSMTQTENPFRMV